MHRYLAFISAILWLATIGFVVLLWVTDSVNSLPVEVVYKKVCDSHTEICTKSPDSISLAMQLGRLDILSISLTILGIGIGLLAIFSFLFIKEKAEIEARIAAREVVEQELQKIVEDARNKIDKKMQKVWVSLEEQLETLDHFAQASKKSDKTSDSISDQVDPTYPTDLDNSNKKE